MTKNGGSVVAGRRGKSRQRCAKAKNQKPQNTQSEFTAPDRGDAVGAKQNDSPILFNAALPNIVSSAGVTTTIMPINFNQHSAVETYYADHAWTSCGPSFRRESDSQLSRGAHTIKNEASEIDSQQAKGFKAGAPTQCSSRANTNDLSFEMEPPARRFNEVPLSAQPEAARQSGGLPKMSFQPSVEKAAPPDAANDASSTVEDTDDESNKPARDESKRSFKGWLRKKRKK